MNYRKIWTNHYGEIPKDENNRSYEIHHIDGNRENNQLENLQCVSPKRHLEIHLEQGNYFAAKMIADRLGYPIREYMLMPEASREVLRKRMTGEGNPMKNPDTAAKVSAALKGRKKPPEVEAKRLKSREGFKHSEETLLKMKKAKSKVNCPYCQKEGGISQMKRWHFNNCKKK